MSGDPLDLTGEWDGVFNYPSNLPPRGFRATLQDHAGALTEETIEENDPGVEGDRTLIALLDGRRESERVSFVKHYDTLARAHYAVHYEGQVSAEGEEITGRWTVPGVWSGTFLMVRRARNEASETRRVSEEVR